MLESLTVKNYAIIDGMTIEFAPGLNIITGETGAGKSIVVDALELLLGTRASLDMIRNGAESLEVTGVFSLVNKTDFSNYLDSEDESVLILRREFKTDGNGRCFVNDRPVTLKTLKEIGDLLVDFHGQHDHQSLFAIGEHVRFLDGFAGLSQLSEKVSFLYENICELKEKLRNIENESQRRDRDIELFRYQLQEIDNADIHPGEDEETESAIRKLSGAGMLKEQSMKLFGMMSESEGSVTEQIYSCMASLKAMLGADDNLNGIMERLESVAGEISDISMFLREYSDSIDMNPELLAEMEERLGVIERLKKKYGFSIEKVLEYREKINKELEKSELSSEETGVLKTRIESLGKEYLTLAKELSEKRKAAAPFLSSQVQVHLGELGMKGARLVVNITPFESKELIETDGSFFSTGKNGIDNVEFLISANTGEPPKPLVKVASGGEISRVMLSLKLVLSDVNRVPSMVFDEIDTGVSGRVAESLGKKLTQLTRGKQAIVITHLPQIAVMGDRHFSARKEVKDGRTSARLICLDYDMRQSELAMLLSGEKLSETAFAHARELLETADKHKNNQEI